MYDMYMFVRLCWTIPHTEYTQTHKTDEWLWRRQKRKEGKKLYSYMNDIIFICNLCE